ncbi:malonate decarboxylase holo-ACP synthase [Massilia sp. UMI-21]|nr:malonate decarboxylase holo-ACP synthase [Massilia sp. UMI-21]
MHAHLPPLRPHDLLWVSDWQAFEPDGALPSWAEAAQRRGCPLVVRRARTASDALLPVGLRGEARSERLAGVLRRSAVRACASPETLVRRELTQPGAAPILTALRRLAPRLDGSGLAWGPTGGLGFALATGWPVLHPASDIDLLVRAPTPLTASQASLLQEVSADAACRVDLQIDTGHGGFAFAEWIRNGGRVLLKTDTGPRMTDDPWEAP